MTNFVPPYDREELSRIIRQFIDEGGCFVEPREEDVLLDAIAEAFRQPESECCSWEADNAKRQLEGTGIEWDEFPYGCDTLQYVATKLAGSRKRVKELEAQLATLTAPGLETVCFECGWRYTSGHERGCSYSKGGPSDS